jgi:sulfur relay (sulfurtransferase) DsrF/TusC family protein
MGQNIVVLVKSDPQESHRPVEAIRIALGLISGDHQVSVILMNNAPLLLGNEAEDLVDGEDLDKYLPPYRELDQTFYVEKEALDRAKLTETDYKIQPISIQEIANLIAKADRHLIF